MWYLTSEHDQRVIYIVGDKKEVTIGRSPDAQLNCFVIPDDPSISRKHAVLTNVNDELFLKDLGSRYGTYKNTHDKVGSNTTIKLNAEDVLTFGKMGSVWTVRFEQFVTCTSTLKGENLQNLKKSLDSLSGSFKSEWDETCKFLTMPAITLTIKVVLALAQGAHIVTVDFWNKCLEAVNSQANLPNPNDFTPQVIESTLNKEVVSFLPDNRRQTLFSGKRVIFFSKRQYEMFKVVLAKASATPLLLSDSKMTKSMLCENNAIVIQCSTAAASQDTQAHNTSILDIVNYMKSKGKRVITEGEIGLAVLYCSTNKYCNPNFNFPSEVIKQKDQTTKSSTVLAQESQEPTQKLESSRNVIIDESLMSSNSAISSKRKLSDDDFQENSNKKFAVHDNDKNGASSGNKRKIGDKFNGIESNPSKKHAAGDEDSFTFVNQHGSKNTSDETSVKRLNLIKPQKRKLKGDDDEDELFQFVQDKQKDSDNFAKPNIFSAKHIKSEPNTNDHKDVEDNVDISVLRGSKLEELMKNNEKIIKSEATTVKRPIKDELDEKMNSLSLGTTIVKVRADLVVKKESIHIEEQSNSQIKNFKKFKKVWPVKMQVTMIPKSSMSINLDTTSVQKGSSLGADVDGKERSNAIMFPDSEETAMIQEGIESQAF